MYNATNVVWPRTFFIFVFAIGIGPTVKIVFSLGNNNKKKMSHVCPSVSYRFRSSGGVYI